MTFSTKREGADPSVLSTHGLAHQFQPNWWCLRELDLTFRTGELVGLVGANGAGKSTLMRALTGQMTPTAGKVELDGRCLSRFSRTGLARRIGYLPQAVTCSFSYTCEEVVAQGRYPHQGALGLLSHEDLAIVRQAMQWTNCEAFAHRYLNELSGGESQRVLLASVLAQGSDFMLLDEPTSALDLHHQVDVFERIYQLARQGMGVIVITHDLNLAAQYCDRLVLLNEGRMRACGPPEEVLREEILSEVYKTDLIVDRNPVTGTPMVVLLGRRGLRQAGRTEQTGPGEAQS